MKTKHLFGSIFAGIMFIGCSGSAPSCDDSSVENVLSKILVSYYKNNFNTNINKKELKYSDHITQDDSTEKITYCKVKASYRGNSERILYSAQYTDKGDKVYVELIEFLD